jgi:hypothetical protein
LKPFQRLLQPDQRKTAFVGESIAHGFIRGHEA